jgi:hypothetical protein
MVRVGSTRVFRATFETEREAHDAAMRMPAQAK